MSQYLSIFEIEPNLQARLSAVNRLLLMGQAASPGGKIGLAPITDSSWKLALNALAVERLHQATQEARDLAPLRAYYTNHIDARGNWLTSIERLESAMKGYSLLYLVQATGEPRYADAASRLVQNLLNTHQRAADGCLTYEPGKPAILVDSLAMICPFLARYARLFDHPAALELCIHQLKQFIRVNLDPESGLPFHGYYAGGPYRLGLHAWGRGVGWYLLGLIDTLGEMPSDHPDFVYLRDVFRQTAEGLTAYQRPDGHWTWAILHIGDHSDSSTTSLVGYSLARGVENGLLDRSGFHYGIESALLALQASTRPDGWVDGGLGECLGLGKYPQNYAPSPWLQGATAAFVSISEKLYG